jgi:hypothetical protein
MQFPLIFRVAFSVTQSSARLPLDHLAEAVELSTEEPAESPIPLSENAGSGRSVKMQVTVRIARENSLLLSNASVLWGQTITY